MDSREVIDAELDFMLEGMSKDEATQLLTSLIDDLRMRIFMMQSTWREDRDE